MVPKVVRTTEVVFLPMKKFGLLALVVLAVNADPKPNIVLIVTDDLVRGLKNQEVLIFM